MRYLGYFVVGICILVGVCFWIAFTAYRSFTIPSSSMAPNLQAGDYILVERFRTSLHAPLQRGDVVSFSHSGQIFVKRIIGLPGDLVALKTGRVELNGVFFDIESSSEEFEVLGASAKVQVETLPSGKSYRVLDMVESSIADNVSERKVPADHYFLLGDNRDNSDDSRFRLGFLAGENVLGKVRFILWNTEGKSIKDRVF